MLITKLQLTALSWILYGGCIAIYTILPFYVDFLQSEQYNFFIQKALLCLLCLYSIFVLFFKSPNFILEKERLYIMFSGVKKIFLYLRRNLAKEVVFSIEEKNSLLLLLVKFYFIPILSIFTLNGFFNILYWELPTFGVVGEDVFSSSPYFIFAIFIFVDVSIFLYGYLFESSTLNNVVISVDKTILGWVVCLVCYPPFNTITNSLFNFLPTDFSTFDNVYLNIFVGGVIMLLTLVYVWATISLGGKASNLTNRGIVTRGAYRIVRHPAYAAKNLVWWIIGIPLIFSTQMTYFFSQVPFLEFISRYVPDLFLSLLSLFAWSFIYYLRAITEERHLREDPAYVDYMKRVPYRFIPNVW